MSLARGAAHFSQCTYAFDAPPWRGGIPQVVRCCSVQTKCRQVAVTKYSDNSHKGIDNFFSSHHLFRHCNVGKHTPNFKSLQTKRYRDTDLNLHHKSCFHVPHPKNPNSPHSPPPYPLLNRPNAPNPVHRLQVYERRNNPPQETLSWWA